MGFIEKQLERYTKLIKKELGEAAWVSFNIKLHANGEFAYEASFQMKGSDGKTIGETFNLSDIDFDSLRQKIIDFARNKAKK